MLSVAGEGRGWMEVNERKHRRRATMLGREARFKVPQAILRDHQDNPMDDRELMVEKQDDASGAEVPLKNTAGSNRRHALKIPRDVCVLRSSTQTTGN